MTTTHPNHRCMWGPYDGRVESLTESCADYVGRIQKSLTGELGTGTHYVTEKAEALRDTAQLLADVCHGVRVDTHRCGAEVVERTGEGDVLDACTLPSGHTGGHNVRMPATPIERAAAKARELRGAAVAMADALGWLSDPSRGFCIDDVDDVTRDLGRLGWLLADTKEAVEALRRTERSET